MDINTCTLTLCGAVLLKRASMLNRLPQSRVQIAVQISKPAFWLTFFQRSDPDDENKLKPGLKLELLQKDDPLSYWVVSVVDAYGLRLRLRLEGSEDEASDVWAYFLSDNVHQLGWGKKNKLRLNIPLGE